MSHQSSQLYTLPYLKYYNFQTLSYLNIYTCVQLIFKIVILIAPMNHEMNNALGKKQRQIYASKKTAKYSYQKALQSERQ